MIHFDFIRMSATENKIFFNYIKNTFISNGILLLTLFFTMIALIILGMGSPTTANYIITSTMTALAIILLLTEPGAEITVTVLLPAHMFAFYFGIVADIIPLVALAACGVSGGWPIKTDVIASKLALATFIIPYIFVLLSELFLLDTTFSAAFLVISTSLIGMIGIGSGVMGYLIRPMNLLERLIGGIGGPMLIYPGGYLDLIGIILLGTLLVTCIPENLYQGL